MHTMFSSVMTMLSFFWMERITIWFRQQMTVSSSSYLSHSWDSVKQVAEVKETGSKILKQGPKTPGMDEIEAKFKEMRKSGKQKTDPTTIESELTDIQNKLAELG